MDTNYYWDINCFRNNFALINKLIRYERPSTISKRG